MTRILKFVWGRLNETREGTVGRFAHDYGFDPLPEEVEEE